MGMYIGIEDLAANALFVILNGARKAGNVNPSVRFADLLKYGMAVIRRLQANGEEATLIYSREANSKMFVDYSDIFVRYTDEEGWDGIALREGKDEQDLLVRCIASIPTDAQAVMGDPRLVGRFFKLAA